MLLPADRTEYSEEQEYSLNAGRYVGIEIEDDKITHEEFNLRLKLSAEKLTSLNSIAHTLEKSIETNLNDLVL